MFGGPLSTGDRETSPVFGGSPLSLWPVTPLVLQQRIRWFLSICVGQWCSSIIAACGGLFSRCGMQAHLSLWLMVNTLFEFRVSLLALCLCVSLAVVW